MGYALISGGRNGAAVSLSNFFLPFANVTSFAAESSSIRTIRQPGYLQFFGVSVDANGTGRSINLRKNSAAWTPTVSFTNSTAQIVYDNAHREYLAAGDTLSGQYIGTAPAFSVLFLKWVFYADGHHVSFWNSGQFSLTATATAFVYPQTSANATESTAIKRFVRAACTMQNLWVLMATNASTTTTTVTSRVGAGSAGNLTVNIGAGATGTFEDLTHTDVLASGDLVGQTMSGMSANQIVGFSGAQLNWTAVNNDIWEASGQSWTFSASSQFACLFAGNSIYNTAESALKAQHGFSGSMSKFRVTLSINSFTGTATVTLRKNGANANEVVSIGAAATGFFEDTTHTDTFAATDDFNVMLTGGTSGSAQNMACSLLETPDPIRMKAINQLDGITAGSSYQSNQIVA